LAYQRINLGDTGQQLVDKLHNNFTRLVEEAPTDGKIYGRRNYSWVEVEASGPVGPLIDIRKLISLNEYAPNPNETILWMPRL